MKIDDLARNLIRLSGFEPETDIPIVYTGLRSGEKLYEEKLMAEEGLRKTENDLIHIGQPIPFDTTQFLRDLEDLAKASYDNSPHIVEMVEHIVPTFHPVGAHPTGNETPQPPHKGGSQTTHPTASPNLKSRNEAVYGATGQGVKTVAAVRVRE